MKIVGRFRGGDRFLGRVGLEGCKILATTGNPPKKVSAQQLTEEIKENDDVARTKYFGTAEEVELIVEGAVEDIKEHNTSDFPKSYFVYLLGVKDYPIKWWVRSAETVGSLKKGDKVVIKGKFQGRDFDQTAKELLLRDGILLQKE